jgi:hypothetical protein
MRLPIAFAFAVAALPFGGCATAPSTVLVDGREVPRPTLRFSGQPFSVRHSRAYPSPESPSSGLRDAGGDISGHVCGMNLDYDVQHKGDHVALDGHIDGPVPSHIDVREDGNARTFIGQIGGAKVALTLLADSLTGTVGRREFNLTMQGDQMVGLVHIEGIGSVPAIVHGVQALGDMPAADQAAVLPSLLTCALAPNRSTASMALEVGIGGTSTDVEPQTSSLYSRN